MRVEVAVLASVLLHTVCDVNVMTVVRQEESVCHLELCAQTEFLADGEGHCIVLANNRPELLAVHPVTELDAILVERDALLQLVQGQVLVRELRMHVFFAGLVKDDNLVQDEPTVHRVLHVAGGVTEDTGEGGEVHFITL
ncbi:hypothetical protein ATCV1_z323R [Acanthocystis turfacea chlorella virus 1]|uniref:Uncharacterized protein z323R n=1 Tax=Chlorovirus heliozoae TaxID=322019 RepID=A7K8T3_9PHYC|nr:hypothetical protein ATCV1_z323R [Acanthocystis turfacea chlorella virus 1]ABT16457.1 hypothetical protein ATCV1_z323R [Acanthocystis turfacea chlorella virus 1]